MHETVETPDRQAPPTSVAVLFGRAPGTKFADVVKGASWRAFRTVLQGLASAFLCGVAGPALFSVTYWETVGFACLAAVLAGLASFLNNIAMFLPEDPTQNRRAINLSADEKGQS